MNGSRIPTGRSLQIRNGDVVAIGSHRHLFEAYVADYVDSSDDDGCREKNKPRSAIHHDVRDNDFHVAVFLFHSHQMIVNGGIDVELFDSEFNKILDERVSSKFPSLFVLNLAETRSWMTWFGILATAPGIVVGPSASVAHLNMCALASSMISNLEQCVFCFVN